MTTAVKTKAKTKAKAKRKPPELWSPLERRAWAPPEPIPPSEWAEQHRHLTRRLSPRYGKWRNDKAPYLVGIMDILARPEIEEVNIKKAAQIGVSEAVRNFIGYCAHMDPDPMMLTLPNEKKGRDIFADRITPLFQETAVLLELQTEVARDMSLHKIRLANGFSLVLAWSGSATSLASDPIRRVVNDEVDKFDPWSGKESDPVRLSYVRTKSYEHHRMVVNISSPTIRDGIIHQRHKASPIKLEYRCPCPKCGHFQVLSFSHLKWEKFDSTDRNERAALIEHNEAVWYECKRCKCKIQEIQKAEMVKRGIWVEENQRISKDGKVLGKWPPGKRVGMHISAMPCLWVSWASIAAEFVSAGDDPRALMDFRNSTLGEIYEQQIVHTRPAVYSGKCKEAAPSGKLPFWTAFVVSTADTQHDHFYYVNRAWGPGGISRRISHGIVETFKDLTKATLQTSWAFEDEKWSPLLSNFLLIDSGGTAVQGGPSRTAQVYEYALSDPARIKAIKGMNKPMGVPVTSRHITYTPGMGGHKLKVLLHFVDTAWFKDVLESRVVGSIDIQDPRTGDISECEIWQLNADDDHDYNRQMASEHKVLARLSGGKPLEVWELITAGADNHYRDVEVYQLAASHMAAVGSLPPLPEIIAARRAEQSGRRQQKHKAPTRGMRMPDGRPYFITER